SARIRLPLPNPFRSSLISLAPIARRAEAPCRIGEALVLALVRPLQASAHFRSRVAVAEASRRLHHERDQAFEVVPVDELGLDRDAASSGAAVGVGGERQAQR